MTQKEPLLIFLCVPEDLFHEYSYSTCSFTLNVKVPENEALHIAVYWSQGPKWNIQEFICKLSSVYYCIRAIHFSSISTKKDKLLSAALGIWVISEEKCLDFIIVTGRSTLLVFNTSPLAAECQAEDILLVGWLAILAK